MTRLARAAVAAALVAAPLAFAGSASAACVVVPVGGASATYCSDMGWTCAGVDTRGPDASACVGPGGQYACEGRLFNTAFACA